MVLSGVELALECLECLFCFVQVWLALVPLAHSRQHSAITWLPCRLSLGNPLRVGSIPEVVVLAEV